MQKQKNIIGRKQIRSSFITSVLSIALVLFLVGIIGLLFLNTQKVSEYIKENIGFRVMLKETIKESDIKMIQKVLDSKKYVRETEYITKDQAAKEMQEQLGEDFIALIGHNPLPPSINVKVYSGYANTDSISFIEKELSEFSQIKEIVYKKSLIHAINENIRKISMIILAFCCMLMIISLTLINNTIRLIIYSKRFIINTMQLVGATKNFIRRPFLYRSILQAIYAVTIAIILMILLIYLAKKEIPEASYFYDAKMLLILFTGMLLTGIVICLISTFFAVNKYLNVSTDKLYF